ncbi:MAG: undecaprenyl-phosphate glucose phosphotransferase [Candidatus Eisenbacteria bacterium]|nr:undecaprenyl-phosphate glucose phosphotransferase [Candidatus Eisenbacteria bacterium]
MGKIERRKRETKLQSFWLLSDFASILISFCLAYSLRFGWPLSKIFPVAKGVPSFTLYFLTAVFLGVLWPVIFRTFGLYSVRRSLAIGQEISSILLAVTSCMILSLALSFFVRDLSYSRLVIGVAWALSMLFVTLGRRVVGKFVGILWRGASFGVAVVGATEVGLRLVSRLRESPPPGFKLAGVILEDEGTQVPEDVPILGSLKDIGEIVSKNDIQTLWFSLPLSKHSEIPVLMENTSHRDLDFEFVPDLVELMSRRSRVTEIDGIPLLSLKEFPLVGWNVVLKRTFDVVFSLVPLILLIPLFAVVALLIKLDSKGPVFYEQQRMGRDGRLFQIHKFRSMIVGAEDKTGPVWVARDDVRRTRLGKLLRRSSVDELPQLLNVLKGEMSLVGPRPERPHFVAEFTAKRPDYFQRHRVKSGITGWAQVNGLRGDTPLEERTDYDLYYIENWSLGFDLKILAMTAKVVLSQRGAY